MKREQLNHERRTGSDILSEETINYFTTLHVSCLCHKEERNKDRLGNLVEGELNSVYIYMCVCVSMVLSLLFLWALKNKSPSSQSWHCSMFIFCFGYKMSVIVVKPCCDF